MKRTVAIGMGVTLLLGGVVLTALWKRALPKAAPPDSNQARFDRALETVRKLEREEKEGKRVSPPPKPTPEKKTISLPRDEENLLRFIRNPSESVEDRVRAVLEMARIRGPNARTNLESLLRGTEVHSFVREAAALGLSQLKDPASKPVLEAVLDDPIPSVRLRAALALGRMGDTSGYGEALEALRQPDVTGKILAGEALGAILEPSRRRDIERLVKAEDYNTRAFASLALAKIETAGKEGTQRVQALRLALRSEYYEVSKWAAVELRKTNSPESRRALYEEADKGSRGARKIFAAMVRSGEIPQSELQSLGGNR